MPIIQKRSLTPNSIPTTSSLAIGELAMNIPDGRIFFRRSGSGTNTLVIGGQGGIGGTTFSAGGFFQPQGESGTPVSPVSFNYLGSGGGPGGGQYNTAAKGIYGSGGGSNASGSNGSVIVEEIYGLV
jgi:hypothetical protein